MTDEKEALWRNAKVNLVQSILEHGVNLAPYLVAKEIVDKTEAYDGGIGPEEASQGGVWTTYAYDTGPYLISLHESEIEALRAAVHYGAGAQAILLPFGKSLSEAIQDAKLFEGKTAIVEIEPESDDLAERVLVILTDTEREFYRLGPGRDRTSDVILGDALKKLRELFA